MVFQPLGEIVGRGDRDEQRDLELLGLGRDGVADVAEEQAGQDVDVVVLDQLADLADRHVRPRLAVLDDQLDLSTGHLVADLIEVHRQTVDHVLGRLGGGAGEIRDEADLDRRALAPRRPVGAHAEKADQQGA